MPRCAASLPQLAVAAYLYSIGEETYALVLLGLILPQMFAQAKVSWCCSNNTHLSQLVLQQ